MKTDVINQHNSKSCKPLKNENGIYPCENGIIAAKMVSIFTQMVLYNEKYIGSKNTLKNPHSYSGTNINKQLFSKELTHVHILQKHESFPNISFISYLSFSFKSRFDISKRYTQISMSTLLNKIPIVAFISNIIIIITAMDEFL